MNRPHKSLLLTFTERLNRFNRTFSSIQMQYCKQIIPLPKTLFTRYKYSSVYILCLYMFVKYSGSQHEWKSDRCLQWKHFPASDHSVRRAKPDSQISRKR